MEWNYIYGKVQDQFLKLVRIAKNSMTLEFRARFKPIMEASLVSSAPLCSRKLKWI
ncbi:hypothetical protein FOCG_03971 [Fusarium oxysporum f. sp. radicis-lycopersici 26381]|uniref:Uncharacterized protein n=1 Tax=Fusarium oxysporum Fo47 TaxID=660027 RepID=W9K609_FUSOX|nr:hypothetical protein FOZG_10789 [Fusarium oxysporum Fo47]EWZ90484.1 hypothetical protein FOWG_08118 [Fusarium oxysporum f. sp. lycopersici MN25]EXL56316.1 hypothetical protein FOCG_03971 [Fusarium oxysporum f. sp. radicis-lycopersici 26381]